MKEWLQWAVVRREYPAVQLREKSLIRPWQVRQPAPTSRVAIAQCRLLMKYRVSQQIYRGILQILSLPRRTKWRCSEVQIPQSDHSVKRKVSIGKWMVIDMYTLALPLNFCFPSKKQANQFLSPFYQYPCQNCLMISDCLIRESNY